MDTIIPAPERFREYSNIIREFLQEMYDTYSDRPPLEFKSPDQQQRTKDWLAWIGPDYKQSYYKAIERLDSEYKDVVTYWESDPAFAVASRKVLQGSGELHPFDAVTERILKIAQSRSWEVIPFSLIRNHAEAGLKWRQALSLVAANFLDGTSYLVRTQMRSSARELCKLIEKLEEQLEKPEITYLSTFLDWPMGFYRTTADLETLKNILQSDEIKIGFKQREDRHLRARIIAGELLEANRWAFRHEHKTVAFILLGLSVFDDQLDLELKTLERIAANRPAHQGITFSELHIHEENRPSNIRDKHRKRTLDKKRAQYMPCFDPKIPNLSLRDQETKDL